VPILGIDIGGTRLKAGLVDDAGAILSVTRTPTPATLAEFRQAMARILEIGPAEGVGIGCKGIIDSATTRVEVLPGGLHYLEGHLLADFAPNAAVVRADNDARAALAGEMAWGAARGRRNAVMLTLGTGVGGGILADGRVLRGSAGVAGHLGHLTVDPEGPVCICGNRGCLETVFSARAIEAEAIAAMLRGCESCLKDPATITCEAVFAAASSGDEVARAICDRAIKYLAGAIAGIFGALDPEVVILGGQIAEAGPVLFEPLQRQVTQRARKLVGHDVAIVRAEVAEAGIVGAAALVKNCEKLGTGYAITNYAS
jgi:glucokinase